MSSFDVVIVHSAFDALRLGRSAQTIGCRRLHFWTRKTSRSKVNSRESLYSSFMRRNR
ncbi:BnaC04g13220D [Brassica napus]|uniref:BnaC04g13220D protein n=1 Tax=Brassica napus TaxID=3708 RepID=A0A078H9Y7_BRANA|nr:BnaC04g13220D [Brassica napus]